MAASSDKVPADLSDVLDEITEPQKEIAIVVLVHYLTALALGIKKPEMTDKNELLVEIFDLLHRHIKVFTPFGDEEALEELYNLVRCAEEDNAYLPPDSSEDEEKEEESEDDEIPSYDHTADCAYFMALALSDDTSNAVQTRIPMEFFQVLDEDYVYNYICTHLNQKLGIDEEELDSVCDAFFELWTQVSRQTVFMSVEDIRAFSAVFIKHLTDSTPFTIAADLPAWTEKNIDELRPKKRVRLGTSKNEE